MNRLNSFGKMSFRQHFPLASTISKGLHWSVVDAQSQLRCLQDLGNIILRGVKPSHPNRAKPLKACIVSWCTVLTTIGKSKIGLRNIQE